jgi:broad specificity phosphatase PhoE
MRIALLVLLSLFALTGCRSLPDPSEGATFILVRHAEKAADDPRDPTLAPEGIRRAERLAWSLQRQPVVAVYATPFRRTQATAAPIARDHGIDVVTYDAAESAVDFAARLRRTHRAGTVVVVGHSNTIPALASVLCECTIGPIAESEYGRRITLRARPDFRVTVDDRREP